VYEADDVWVAAVRVCCLLSQRHVIARQEAQRNARHEETVLRGIKRGAFPAISNKPYQATQEG
jgi:hypothetical protein